jgi:hypothetical protein
VEEFETQQHCDDCFPFVTVIRVRAKKKHFLATVDAIGVTHHPLLVFLMKSDDPFALPSAVHFTAFLSSYSPDFEMEFCNSVRFFKKKNNIDERIYTQTNRERKTRRRLSIELIETFHDRATWPGQTYRGTFMR